MSLLVRYVAVTLKMTDVKYVNTLEKTVTG
jgi:hypothetical protein